MTIGDVELEYQIVEGDRARSWLVFLHEGLGSVELWRDFPASVAEKSGNPALVYSRAGHGWSSPVDGARGVDFMHHEALTVLPSVLERLAIGEPILVGHSDGASIALIHAARFSVRGVVAMAPHVFVEPESLAGISAAGRVFAETDLTRRMARYHHDAAATFHAWYDTWTDPRFRDWNIEALLPGVTCPLLLVQGSADEYGTDAQLEAITAGVAGPVERLWLEGCGHSPHLDAGEEVTAAVVEFVRGLG